MTKKTKLYKLKVFNNESSQFGEVISLFKTFGLTTLQSQQCALIIHNVGSYDVLHGSYDEMKSAQMILNDYNIQSEIISDEPIKNKTK